MPSTRMSILRGNRRGMSLYYYPHRGFCDDCWVAETLCRHRNGYHLAYGQWQGRKRQRRICGVECFVSGFLALQSVVPIASSRC